MSTTAARQSQEVLDPSPRTRHSRLEDPLAIPANSITVVTPNTDVRTVQNWLNRLPDGWNSPQSPDELVIQKRGRRKSIVWSPDFDTYKRRSLLSLSARDHTPVKNSITSDMTFRDSARKRLSLTDTHQSEFSTPKSRKILSSGMSLDTTDTSRGQSNDNLVNSLRGLSHEQLVHLIMDLVYAQEDGTLCKNEKLRNILLNKMPTADIQPLIDKLAILRQNVYTSLVFASNLDDNSTYSRAYLHMDAFQKTVVDQGRLLQESHHWASLMHYVLEAWKITRELPEWKSEDPHNNITHKCFKDLSQFCTEAITKGNFETSVLEEYIESLETIVGECEDFQICLQTAKEAKGSK
nr:PREDICTED: uncharacterized protein LOC105678489 [Linepithema humile]XP_012233314.1 PREDICTED: uncharacterized protein LOC105678489 [Linepithema humile]